MLDFISVWHILSPVILLNRLSNNILLAIHGQNQYNILIVHIFQSTTFFSYIFLQSQERNMYRVQDTDPTWICTMGLLLLFFVCLFVSPFMKCYYNHKNYFIWAQNPQLCTQIQDSSLSLPFPKQLHKFHVGLLFQLAWFL